MPTPKTYVPLFVKEHEFNGATHLEDVVNSAMPDGERVAGIKTKAKRLRKKADDFDRDAMIAKLEQVASIRHQHPIARVAQSLALPEVA